MSRKPPAPPAPQKRILMVDDHPVFRDGLRRVISMDRDLVVCGEAGSAEEAWPMIGPLQPDLVITDITLPGKSGIELLRDVRAVHPDLPVILISMHDERLYAERALRAGARGYIMKHEGPGRMLEAVQQVLRGKVALSDKMAAELLLSIACPRSREGMAAGAGKLTSREFEVLCMIGDGQDARDISRSLRLSVKTVDTHRAHIRDKLGLKNNTELIRYAVRWREGEPHQP